MKSSVIYSPDESEGGTFDIGILIPAYEEGATPFVGLSKWLDAVTVLEKRFRVLILIIVNGPSSDIPLNQVTLEFSKDLQSLVQSGLIITSGIARSAYILFEEIQNSIYRNSARVKIILGESYNIGNNIGMARHKGCCYLKEALLPSGIIVSTDSDSWPTSRSYLQNAITILEGDPDIGGITGEYNCVLVANASNRTHQLHTYEKVSSFLHRTLEVDLFTNEDWDSLEDLALMPGSNSVFRARLYSENICYSDRLSTGEDMDFSRRLLEAGHKVTYYNSIAVDTLYRPSDRTAYGLGTEISKVNVAGEFLVLHPQVGLGKRSVYNLFKHVSEMKCINEEFRCTYLIQCLRDELGDDIMDEKTVKELRDEIISGKGLLIGRVYLNDKAIRIVYDRLSDYLGRLRIEEAYEWIIKFIQERLILIEKSNHGSFLYTIFLEELKKMRAFDKDTGNYEVFVWMMLEKIKVALSSIRPNEYQNKVIRLEPIPSPEMPKAV